MTGARPTALVVVDMQVGFLTGASAVPQASQLIQSTGRLLSAARAAGSLVVHLQNDGQPGAADEPGAPGWSLMIEPERTEHVLRKRKDDGFIGTDLAAILDRHGVRALVLCGLQSEMCVAATARGAMARGIQVVLPRDAHGTYAILADENRGVAVPADHVARVAEWSLGDEVIVVDESTQVDFGSSADVTKSRS